MIARIIHIYLYDIGLHRFRLMVIIHYYNHIFKDHF